MTLRRGLPQIQQNLLLSYLTLDALVGILQHHSHFLFIDIQPMMLFDVPA